MLQPSLLVHAILGVSAQHQFFRPEGGFPGSHGPECYDVRRWLKKR